LSLWLAPEYEGQLSATFGHPKTGETEKADIRTIGVSGGGARQRPRRQLAAMVGRSRYAEKQASP